MNTPVNPRLSYKELRVRRGSNNSDRWVFLSVEHKKIGRLRVALYQGFILQSVILRPSNVPNELETNY